MGAPFSLDPSATAAFAKLEQDVGVQALHDTAAPVKAVVIGGGTGAPVSMRSRRVRFPRLSTFARDY